MWIEFFHNLRFTTAPGSEPASVQYSFQLIINSNLLIPFLSLWRLQSRCKGTGVEKEVKVVWIFVPMFALSWVLALTKYSSMAD